MKKLLFILLFTGLFSVFSAEKQGVRPGYENPYTANITRFVPIPLNLQGQYKKAYAACENILKTLPENTQSLQVLCCWKNMVHALKALQQNEKLEPLRSQFLKRYPRNIPFLAALDLEAIPPFGHWQDHTFKRGEPGKIPLPIFPKWKEDRMLLLRHLTDPYTLQLAQRVPDPELKKLYFINLRKMLLTGNEPLSAREVQLLQECNKILRKVPLDKKTLIVKIPRGSETVTEQQFQYDFHTVLLGLFAKDTTFSFRDLKSFRLPSGGYGLLPDITEKPHLLLTAWGCEATQFLGRIQNDPAAIPERKETVSLLANHLTKRYTQIKNGKEIWNDEDAFLAYTASRLGQRTNIIRMYDIRQKLSPFARIMIARALPENTVEHRTICNELKTLQPEDAKTLAAYLIFLRETAPADPRIPALKKQAAATPFSLWKARALYGSKIIAPPQIPPGLEIKTEPKNGKLILYAKPPLQFLRIGLPEILPAPAHGFRTYENQTKSIHRTTNNGREFLIFCTLPPGKHIIDLPPFTPGTITAEYYNF